MGAARGRRGAAAARAPAIVAREARDRPLPLVDRDLLFLSTVINYIDRQTLSVLGPHLKTEFGWTNEKFALIIIAFRLAYTVMQPVSGRLLDRFGTRNGLTLGVLWYSVAAMLTSLATGLRSFCGLASCSAWARRELAGRRPRRWRSGSRGASADGRSRSSTAGRLSERRSRRCWCRSSTCGSGGWRPAFLITGALGLPLADRVAAQLLPAGLHPAAERGGAAR